MLLPDCQRKENKLVKENLMCASFSLCRFQLVFGLYFSYGLFMVILYILYFMLYYYIPYPLTSEMYTFLSLRLLHF